MLSCFLRLHYEDKAASHQASIGDVNIFQFRLCSLFVLRVTFTNRDKSGPALLAQPPLCISMDILEQTLGLSIDEAVNHLKFTHRYAASMIYLRLFFELPLQLMLQMPEGWMRPVRTRALCSVRKFASKSKIVFFDGRPGSISVPSITFLNHNAVCSSFARLLSLSARRPPQRSLPSPPRSSPRPPQRSLPGAQRSPQRSLPGIQSSPQRLLIQSSPQRIHTLL